MSCEDSDDGAGDLVLDSKHVFKFSVIALGPAMGASSRVDELRRDTHAISSSADTAFEHVAYAELPAHFPDVGRLPFVLEARVARDDEELGEAGELCDDVLGDAVAEVVLFWVAAEIGEWKDCMDGLSGRVRAGLAAAATVTCDACTR